ncbi:MAG: cupredoxin domain-containing protein [Candidatus Diapherotrites archaeon]|nr:cupredoxin domain-containing protein [Candidatus Diapherotrites archaeon]
MKKTALALIALALLAGCVQQTDKTTTSGNPNAPLKEFDITAKQFSFEPEEITVEFGDRVKLSITSPDVEHSFALPEFNVNKTIPAGQTVTVEFVAEKKGRFTFYCSVYCGAGHSEMNGALIVE